MDMERMMLDRAVFLYMPQCGACNRFKQEFSAMHPKLYDLIQKVNVTEHAIEGIDSVPVVMVEDVNGVVQEYVGGDAFGWLSTLRQ